MTHDEWTLKVKQLCELEHWHLMQSYYAANDALQMQHQKAAEFTKKELEKYIADKHTLVTE